MNIKLQNVSFSYGIDEGLPIVVSDASLEIDRGEFVGIVGPSGSGKTTLLELLSGFIESLSGSVLYDGDDIYSNGSFKPEFRKKISMVFQFPEKQVFEDTVYDDVSFGPRNHGISGEELEKLVKKSLEFVGLEFARILHKSPFNLSSGEQRRVAIAGILASDPEIILLDEPTIAVDFIGFRCIEKIVNSVHQDGKTVVIVSHDMDLIAKNVSRIVALRDGEIVYNGNKDGFFGNRELVRDLNLEVPEIIDIIEKHNLKNIDNIYDIQVLKKHLSSKN